MKKVFNLFMALLVLTAVISCGSERREEVLEDVPPTVEQEADSVATESVETELDND